MSEFLAVGMGLMMTALAVGAGGLALEALLLILNRALRTPRQHIVSPGRSLSTSSSR